MDVGLIAVIALLLLVALNAERQAAAVRRDLARLDRKLAAALEKLGVTTEDWTGLSERVKELARDPGRKIEAIKVYREETGAGLAEAKAAVEAIAQPAPR
jgi:ribosomal protein L7/L12